MSIFDRIRGRAPPPPTAKSSDLRNLKHDRAPVEAPGPLSATKADQKKIVAYNTFGQPITLNLDQWRSLVLEPTRKESWDNADALAGFILRAQQDQLYTDILPLAERLYHLEPQLPRSAVLYGSTLRGCGSFDLAKQVLERSLTDSGDNAGVTIALVQVLYGTQEYEKARPLVVKVLSTDPNEPTAFLALLDLARREAGESGMHQAVQRLAALPNSWRARLTMASNFLVKGDRVAALALYDEAIRIAPRPVPYDLLLRMSGDLGKHEHLPELIAMTEPWFDAKSHGLSVGVNLIKAHFDLGDWKRSQELLDTLYIIARPEWQPQLAFWENELIKAAAQRRNLVVTEAPEVNFALFPRVIWLKPDSELERALLAPAPQDHEPIILFGGTCESGAAADGDAQAQMDFMGLLTRVLPAYLAERLAFHRVANPQLLLTWIAKPNPGMALMNGPWDIDAVVQHAANVDSNAKWAVATHITPHGNAKLATLQVLDLAHKNIATTIAEVIEPEAPKAPFDRVADAIETFFSERFGVPPTRSDFYRPPIDAWFLDYISRLDQLIHCRCQGPEGVASGHSYGHRAILDGTLLQCLAAPDNPTVRALFISMFAAVRHARPAVALEYQRHLERIQLERPFAEPMQSLLAGRIDEILAAPAGSPVEHSPPNPADEATEQSE